MILLAPDKFKGTMKACEAADAMARGLRRAGVTSSIAVAPMADGGEGTAGALGAEPVADCPGAYRLADGVALLMSCELCGANLSGEVPEERSSRLLGEAVMSVSRDSHMVYIGVGGTLSADGGAGFLQALGWTFIDARGRRIDEPPAPCVLASRGLSAVVPGSLRLPRIVGLCDVACPLQPASRDGALSVMSFVKQKGFVTDRQRKLVREAAMLVSRTVRTSTGKFGGAGGGLGYAIGAVPGADCRFGAEVLIESRRNLFEQACLIITGEGCIDMQTAGGKCVDAVFRFGEARGIPVLAVGGRVVGCPPYPMTVACQAPEASVPGRDAPALLEAAVEKWALANLALCN